MGAAIATRLIEEGHTVTVWNRTAGRAAAFDGRAAIATDAAQALTGADLGIISALDNGAARSILEQGDVEGALAAATAIGDDTLQRQSQGQVVPDSFTHGTSAQRVRWFSKGLQTGQLKQCDTFSGQAL